MKFLKIELLVGLVMLISAAGCAYSVLIYGSYIEAGFAKYFMLGYPVVPLVIGLYMVGKGLRIENLWFWERG